MPEIMYIYPQWHIVSFTLVARHHIHYLRKITQVYEVDETWLDAISCASVLASKRVYMLHPLFYMLWNRDIARRVLRQTAEKLIGFEVADTDRISEKAVELANEADLIIVPSRWVREVFIRSGVKTSIEVVPHGVSELFKRERRVPTLSNLLLLYFLKKERGYKYVLFFLHHSGYRKGADLVYEVMKKLQQKYRDLVLVVKRSNIADPYLARLRKLRMIEVAGWLSEDDLIDLYDVCDICFVPSRGGGFELPALEALARGLITIVPNAGCFLDYANYCITVKVAKWVPVFRDNPIHVGLGHEIDVDDAVSKFEEVLENYSYWKSLFEKRRGNVLKRFSWGKVCLRLITVLRQHGVIR